MNCIKCLSFAQSVSVAFLILVQWYAIASCISGRERWLIHNVFAVIVWYSSCRASSKRHSSSLTQNRFDGAAVFRCPIFMSSGKLSYSFLIQSNWEKRTSPFFLKLTVWPRYSCTSPRHTVSTANFPYSFSNFLIYSVTIIGFKCDISKSSIWNRINIFFLLISLFHRQGS